MATTIQEAHAMMVAELCKPGVDIAKHLTENPELAHLWHMASCIQGEAGELFDAIKKMAIYEQPLDREKFTNIEEELGDIEYYLEGFRQGMGMLIKKFPIWTDCDGISRGMTLEANIMKLRKRYGKNYSNEAAQARVDKFNPAQFDADNANEG